MLQAQAPKTVSPVDWERLASKAILRAERAGDSRAQAIKHAVSQGQADRILKRMGIIGETDLVREFPIRDI